MPRRRAPWSARHSRPHRGQARGGAAAHTARACAPPRVSALRRQHRQRHPCRLARQRRHDTHAPTTTTAFLRQATTSTLPTQSSEQRAPRRRAHGVGPASPPLAGLRLPAFTDAPTSPARSSAPAPNPAFTATPGAVSRTAISHPARNCRQVRRATPRLLRGPVHRCHERRVRMLVADGGPFRRRPRPPTSLRPHGPSSPRAALSTSATAAYLASSRRTADASRPT